jgi:hypothetical protein
MGLNKPNIFSIIYLYLIKNLYFHQLFKERIYLLNKFFNQLFKKNEVLNFIQLN